jgi:hypothetical protein
VDTLHKGDDDDDDDDDDNVQGRSFARTRRDLNEQNNKELKTFSFLV